MIRDFLRFLRYNLQHYALALWGFRLRLDPAYPWVSKFLPALLSEPVFEYRTYGLTALWGTVLAWLLPLPVLTALILLWFGISWDRSKYFASGLVFWRRALKENGLGHHRSHGRYIEQLIREMERQMKAGEDWQQTALEAQRLQDDVIQRHGSKEAAKRILAGA